MNHHKHRYVIIGVCGYPGYFHFRCVTCRKPIQVPRAYVRQVLWSQ